MAGKMKNEMNEIIKRMPRDVSECVSKIRG